MVALLKQLKNLEKENAHSKFLVRPTSQNIYFRFKVR